ncbi:unnamed protein product, partial [Effrenium voratum]
EHGAAEVAACGASALGAFALKGGEVHRASLAQSRALQLLLQALKDHVSSSAVQERAASALRSIISGDAAAKARAVQLGAVEVLVAALTQEAPSVLAAALSALLCLSQPPPCEGWSFALVAPDTPVECDAATLLLILDRHEQMSIQESALALLWGRLEKGQEVDGGAGGAASAAARALKGPQRLHALGAAVLKCVPKKGTGKFLMKAIRAQPKSRALQERAWQAVLKLLQGENELDIPFALERLTEAMELHSGPLQRIGCDIMTLCCLPDVGSTESRELLLRLKAPKLCAEALRKHPEQLEMQESGCAALQCLAGETTSGLGSVEESLLGALEAQPHAQAVQVRALDLLAAMALERRQRGAGPLLATVDRAVDALRRHGQEDEELAEVALKALQRLLDCDMDDEPMERIAEIFRHLEGRPAGLGTRTLLRHLAKHCSDVATRIIALQGVQPVAKSTSAALLELGIGILNTLALRSVPARRLLLRQTAPALQAMRLKPDRTWSCAAALLSRLAADGEAAAAQLAQEALELLLAGLEAGGDVEADCWGFLALQNLCCGCGPAAARRRWAVEQGALALVARRAAEPPSELQTLLETILGVCLHSLGTCCEDADLPMLASDELLTMLFRALDASAYALEVRERAGFLLCYLAKRTEKVKATFTQGGSSLWKSILEMLKDHLAAADEEEAQSGDAEEAPDELLLELTVPLASCASSCWLRALHVSRPALAVEAMQALPFDSRIQVVAATALRLLALKASYGRGRDRSAMQQLLPLAVEAIVEAMRAHQRSDEVQHKAVLALQSLLRLSTSAAGEGEEAAIDRLVRLEAVPVLVCALQNYPEDGELQERGLDVLRVIATGSRRPEVEQSLAQLGLVPIVVEAMNLNISKPKIQEYGLSLLAEIGWQGMEQQQEILATLGVETVVRALRAFPESGEVQTSGLAAVQALSSGNEECRVKFFALAEILEVVMQAMGNFPLVEGVQAFGCAALVSLAHSKPERVGALADLNCSSLVESAMVGHPNSQRVLGLAERLMEVLKKG